MTESTTPEFAVIGHPNEGKSAVVSTLAEDDSVRVSPYPGETLVCRTFPVTIDNIEVIRFTDTPGFQNPQKLLAWMKDYQGPEDKRIQTLIETHTGNHDFDEDCELFKPVARGAGIIYVVDGSRPVRNVDLAEMEILRLTGCPRMAIINCKEDYTGYLDDWKTAFRKHFNAIRIFSAHRATYAERIALLETLKGIDQDWGSALDTVISAFKDDWRHRNDLTAGIICTMLENSLLHTATKNFTENTDEKSIKKILHEKYNLEIEKIEREAHLRIRRLFKHNIFNYNLQAHSVLKEELFSEKTWQVLGLTPKQLIITAAVAGGTVGAAIDIAAAGLTFGIFTSLGGIIGAGWTALGGGKRLAKSNVKGISLGGRQITIGPIDNIQFPFILLDRVLIYYTHIINWAHGRRNLARENSDQKQPEKEGFTFQWDKASRNICRDLYSAVKKNNPEKREKAVKDFKDMLQDKLFKISISDRDHMFIS